MTNNIIRLTFIHAKSISQNARAKVSKKKKGNRAVSAFKTILLYLFFFAILAYYDVLIMNTLFTNGMGALVLPVSMTISAALVLFTTLFRVSQYLLVCKDNDMLFSLPIKHWHILLSRYIGLYLFEVTVPLCFLGVSYAMYIYYYGFSFGYLIFVLTGILLCPMFPLLISGILGALLAVLTAKLPYKNLFQIFFYIALIGGIYYVSFTGSSNGGAGIALGMAGAQSGIANIFYPIALYAKGLQGNIPAALAFVAISIASAFLLVFLLTKFFYPMNRLLTGQKLRGNFKLKKMKAGSARAALLRKEFSRYISSSMYVINSTINLLLLLAASIAIFFFPQIDMLREIPEARAMIYPILPFAIAFLLASASTSNVSLSLEGKSIWLPASLPVTSVQVFHAKLGLNLILSLPVALLSSVLFAIRFQVTGSILCFLLLLPLLYALFTAVFGLFINICLPNFTWTNELAVIKQSSPVFITIIVTILLSVLPPLGILLLEIPVMFMETGIAIVLSILTLLFYILIRRTQLTKFS